MHLISNPRRGRTAMNSRSQYLRSKRIGVFSGGMCSMTARYELAAMTAGLAIGWAMTGRQDQKAAPAPPPPEVIVTPVVQMDVPLYNEWVATLDGFDNAQIQPQVTGYIVAQTYREGSPVKKGQVLFEIDPRDR